MPGPDELHADDRVGVTGASPTDHEVGVDSLVIHIPQPRFRRIIITAVSGEAGPHELAGAVHFLSPRPRLTQEAGMVSPETGAFRSVTSESILVLIGRLKRFSSHAHAKGRAMLV
jgi:hypothetical protein